MPVSEPVSEYEVSGKVQYSARKTKDQIQELLNEVNNRPAQFQQIDDSWDKKDPLEGVWLNYLTDAEAKALGIMLDKRRGKTFSQLLVQLIRERGYRDPEVYRRAQIDQRLFSKIVSDRYYRPAKDTVIAFALALRCSLEEAEKLLESAGFLLSHSSRRDMLIEWSFKNHVYDVIAVNEILDRFDEKIIGRTNVG